MAKIEGNSRRRFRVGSHATVRTIGDERVILDSRSGSYVRLSEVASVVWSGIEDGQDDLAIVDHIAAEYSVERAVVLTDVQDLILDLVARQLIFELTVGEQ